MEIDAEILDFRHVLNKGHGGRQPELRQAGEAPEGTELDGLQALVQGQAVQLGAVAEGELMQGSDGAWDLQCPNPVIRRQIADLLHGGRQRQ